MSKDIIVLTPAGRRQKVKCTPDTNFLQILEDVCQKQGLQPSDYDLKHHNHVLDLTTTIRFSNLPNKAMLEMIETDNKRKESNVTIGLQLEDGERRTADFATTTTLYELVESLAPSEIAAIQQPTIMYMRQEVIGETALKGKTLRQLGLIKGRAILRLLNKQEEPSQANVSSVYRKSVIQPRVEDVVAATSTKKDDIQHSSALMNSNVNNAKFNTKLDLISKFKEDMHHNQIKEEEVIVNKEKSDESLGGQTLKENVKEECKMDIDVDRNVPSTSKNRHENLERRLQIEEEVTFLGSQKAIAFMPPENIEEELTDLPDDFYELSVEEVRKLYKDLQQSRIHLENIPLLSAEKAKDNNKMATEERQAQYKNAVVRIQFPDGVILQGIFVPSNTIADVTNFIKEYLRNPNRKFLTFSTPLKEPLDPKMTLLDARFVPCVHMHFKWLDEDIKNQRCLKEEVYSKITPADAASILASKYRAPSRRKQENSDRNAHMSMASTSKGTSKVPKWFKN